MCMCMHMCVELTGGPPVRWFVIISRQGEEAQGSGARDDGEAKGREITENLRRTENERCLVGRAGRRACAVTL